MKRQRFKPSKVHSTILGLGGRKNRKITVPLTVQRDPAEPSTASDGHDNFDVSENMDDELKAPSKSDVFRKANSYVNWTNLRPKLLSAFVDSLAIPVGALCLECQEAAVARCKECGPNQILCRPCAGKVHENRNQFHVLELWQVSVV